MTTPGSRLAGKTAVITGASKNIGRAIAFAYAEEGADLVICARGKEALEETASEVRKKTGRKVEAVVADVSEEAGIAEVIRRANAAFPRIDVLVNNAYNNGGTYGKKFVDLSWKDWEGCVNANVRAPFLLSQTFGKQMLKNGGGSIVNVVAVAAFMLLDGYGPYGSTKAALWTMTRYLAAELAAGGVRLNAIAPGTVSDTGSLAEVPGWQSQMAFTPMNRPGKATEAASAAVFLASEESSYMTCNLLFLDGGRGAIRRP